MGIADITSAKLAREQWDRYRQSYLPILEGLSNDLMTQERLKESLALVPEQVESSFSLQRANQTAQMERMGVDPTQSATAETKTGIAKAKAQSSAENELRTFNKDLREKAILGATGSMGSLQQLAGG